MNTELRTFISRRPAWTAHGLEPDVEIMVQARNSVHAAGLIRDAVDERFKQHGRKTRKSKAAA